jgi:hypothetical protein
VSASSIWLACCSFWLLGWVSYFSTISGAVFLTCSGTVAYSGALELTYVALTALCMDFHLLVLLLFSLTISPILFAIFSLTGVTDISTLNPVLYTAAVNSGVSGFWISFGGSYRIKFCYTLACKSRSTASRRWFFFLRSTVAYSICAPWFSTCWIATFSCFLRVEFSISLSVGSTVA